MASAAGKMLPTPKAQRPKPQNTGVTLPEGLRAQLEKIVRDEKVKSRNQLITSMLTFDVALFPLLKKVRKQLDALAKEWGLSEAEVIGRLIEMGIAAHSRDKQPQK